MEIKRNNLIYRVGKLTNQISKTINNIMAATGVTVKDVVITGNNVTVKYSNGTQKLFVIPDRYLESGVIDVDNNLILTKNDGVEITIDLTQFENPSTYFLSGITFDGGKVELTGDTIPTLPDIYSFDFTIKQSGGSEGCSRGSLCYLPLYPIINNVVFNQTNSSAKLHYDSDVTPGVLFVDITNPPKFIAVGNIGLGEIRWELTITNFI